MNEKRARSHDSGSQHESVPQSQGSRGATSRSDASRNAGLRNAASRSTASRGSSSRSAAFRNFAASDKSKVVQRSLVGLVGVVTVVAAASALFQFGSRNDAPINQLDDIQISRTTAPSSAKSDSQLLGVTTLPKDIQSLIPEGVRSRIATCIESDASMPMALNGEVTPGYTCLLPLDMGANVVVSIAKNQEIVVKINQIGPTLEGYAPLELANTSGFSAVAQNTSFLMAVYPDQSVIQEYACNGVYPEEVTPCLDELKQRTNAQTVNTPAAVPSDETVEQPAVESVETPAPVETPVPAESPAADPAQPVESPAVDPAQSPAPADPPAPEAAPAA